MLLRFNNDYWGVEHVVRIQHDPTKKLIFIQTDMSTIVHQIDGSGAGPGQNPKKYAAFLAWLTDPAANGGAVVDITNVGGPVVSADLAHLGEDVVDVVEEIDYGEHAKRFKARNKRS